MDEELRSLILNRATASSIAQKGIQNGMHTLRDDGWKKVIETKTTIEEVLRVTQTEEHLKSLFEDSKSPAWPKGS
jgi:type II secretory ATPase GspE/PulE/Tfp pilus assembly ATPase PilB-like protein